MKATQLCWRTTIAVGSVSIWCLITCVRAPATAQPLPAGSELRVDRSATMSASYPSVAIDDEGSFVVVWQSFDRKVSNIVAQRFDTGGERVGVEFVVDTRGRGAGPPSIGMATDGSFLVAWTARLRGQLRAFGRFFGEGLPSGPLLQLDTLRDAPWGRPIAVSMNELAESLVVWNDGCGNVGQRLDRFGDRVGDAFPLGASDALPSTEGFCGFAPFPSVALGADGGFVVAERYPTNYGYGSTVIARRFLPSGEPASGTLNVGPPPSFEPPSRWDDAPAAASKPDGGFVVAWRSTSYPAAAVVRAKLYRAGNTVSADLEVASAGFESAEGLAPSIATSPDGAFLVVWRQERVMGRWYDTHGIELGEAFTIGTTPGRGQPAVAISANGTAVVVWGTPGRRRSPAGVFAQRFTARQD